MLGLLCWVGFSLVVKSGDHCLVAVGGLLIAVASLVAELRLQARGLNSCGLRALHCRLSSVVQGLSCWAACGIFLDQGSNQCPLHWQADSYPLYHQVSPNLFQAESPSNVVTTIELINLPRIHSTINSVPLKEHFLSLSLFSTLDNVFKHFSSTCRLFKDTSFISFMSKSQVLRIRHRCGSEQAGVLF